MSRAYMKNVERHYQQVHQIHDLTNSLSNMFAHPAPPTLPGVANRPMVNASAHAEPRAGSTEAHQGDGLRPTSVAITMAGLGLAALAGLALLSQIIGPDSFEISCPNAVGSCDQRLRLPKGRTGVFGCPKCKVRFVADGNGGVSLIEQE